MRIEQFNKLTVFNLSTLQFCHLHHGNQIAKIKRRAITQEGVDIFGDMLQK